MRATFLHLLSFVFASCLGISAATATEKPKLLIIFDDVINKKQVQAIQSIGLTVNYAFIPPSKNHPHSAEITRLVDEYMVHLPLQAQTFGTKNALTTHDSQASINRQIAQVRKNYPNARYINNHTGSRFTANPNAMRRLMKALKKYRFDFIDSRTTAQTVGKKAAANAGVVAYERDVFYDHHLQADKILDNINESILLAKTQGIAIAISHPKALTLATLKRNKHRFDDVELIRLSQLPQSQRFAQRYQAQQLLAKKDSTTVSEN